MAIGQAEANRRRGQIPKVGPLRQRPSRQREVYLEDYIDMLKRRLADIEEQLTKEKQKHTSVSAVEAKL